MGEMWAITSLFNPAGFKARARNFRQFGRELSVPLMAVELSFDGTFELGPNDADELIQVHGGDRMWQKERLLNLALEKLPRDCRYVAVLDSDLRFCENAWPAEVVSALENHAVVQPFQHIRHLPPPGEAREERPLERGAAYAMRQGESLARNLKPDVDRANGLGIGYAWVHRRETLARHGLYDRCVIGGGDTAMLSAALGQFELVMEFHQMNDRQRARYLEWAEPYYAEVQGQIGFVEGTVEHLWHGVLANREGRRRHEILVRHEFDPVADLAIGSTGAWQWNSDKPALHRAIREYFLSRKEDG